MGKVVKASEDVFVPHYSGREGAFVLIARKGNTYDESLLRGEKPVHGLVSTQSLRGAENASEVGEDADDETPEAPSYDGMKKDELKAELERRGIDPGDLKKDELVEALEYDDASHGV